MPTYEYQCPDCDYEFEEFQSISAAPIKKCPNCGKNRVRRLIGCGSAVIFKGSGFYQTDYRSESYQKAAQAEKEKTSSAKSDSAGSAKGDSAGSAKSDSASSAKSDSASSTKTDSGNSTKTDSGGSAGKASKKR